MSDKIVKSTKFTPTDINFGDVKVSPNGSRSMYISYNGTKLSIQTPLKKGLGIPYGVNKTKFGEPGSTDGKPSLEISFKGMEEIEEIKDLHTKILEIENIVKAYALKNSQTFFKKKIKKDVLDEFFCSSIKVSKGPDGEPDGKYPDTFKLGLRHDSNNTVINTPVFDKTSKTLVEDTSKLFEHRGMKGSSANLIFSCRGVWISASKFGISWTVEQIALIQAKGIGKEWAFVEDSGADSNSDDDDSDDDISGSDDD